MFSAVLVVLFAGLISLYGSGDRSITTVVFLVGVPFALVVASFFLFALARREGFK